MDNTPSNQDNISSDLIPEVDKLPAKPKDTGDVRPMRSRRTTPKPLVEGINTPAAGTQQPAPQSPMLEPSPIAPVIPPKITLTNSEKQLIEDPQSPLPSHAASPSLKPKAFMDQPVQKIMLPGKRSSRKLVWSLLISLLAVSLVYGGLLLYNSQTGGSLGENFSLFPKRPATQSPIVNNNSAPVANPNPAVNPSTAPVVTPPAATSTPAATQVKVAATPTGFLNVRSTPATSGTLVTKVHPGEVYTYTKVQGGWYYITLPNGTQGWVIAQYVEVLK
jgi:hypothetical protein